MNANGTGKGVFHDGAVTQFALAQTTATPANPKATLANILADTTCKAMLNSSAVYAGESATLAKLKEDMEAKSKTSPRSCRDAFITDTGTETGKVKGYVSDIDIAGYGAYKSQRPIATAS